MGFLDLFRPKWRHRDAAVRRAAVAVLEPHQESIALKVARHDADGGVRAVAATRVVSEAGLRALLAADDAGVQRAARERLAGKAVEIACSRPLIEAKALLDGIDERSSLAEVVRQARDQAVREAAFAKLLADPEASQAVLALIAIQDADGGFARRAVAVLTRRGLLKDIARKAKHEDARAAAAARQQALAEEAEKPSDEQRRRERAKRLRALADRAANLAVTSDTVRALADLAGLESEWNDVVAAYPGLAEDQPMTEAATRIARARATAQSRDERARDEAARERDREVFLDIVEETAAYATEAARADLVARWRTLGSGRPEQQARFLRLMAAKPVVEGDRTDSSAPAAPIEPDEATRTALEALSAECEALAASEDLRAAADRWPLLHKRWLQLTGTIGERHPLARRFTDAYAAFKQRRRDARAERDARDQERLELLRQLATRAEALASAPAAAEDQRVRFDELKALQAEWKAVGPVRPALVDAVRGRFRTALDRAFAPVKALQEAEDWNRFANAAKAEELIAAVEALAQVEDVARVAREVRAAHQAWRGLGAQPRGKSRELWDRFKAACDVQYARAKVVFAEQDAQRQANLVAKQALLAELDALAARGPVGLAGSVADRQAKQQALERVREIQAQWKDIGPVPRSDDRALWTRFKAACDPFFAEGNREREREQSDNLAAKIALCEEAERMAGSAEGVPGAIVADRQRWLKQVRELQARWKPIGYVPMADKEPIWQRFKAACDRIYDLTRDELAAQEVERGGNLVKKQALIAELEQLLAGAEDPSRHREEVKRLQDRWRDIGHVPREQFEATRGRWQELCDRVFRA